MTTVSWLRLKTKSTEAPERPYKPTLVRMDQVAAFKPDDENLGTKLLVQGEWLLALESYFDVLKAFRSQSPTVSAFADAGDQVQPGGDA